MRVIIGEGSCGIAAGAGKVHEAITAIMKENENFTLGSTGCIGMCFLEPIVDLYDGDTLVRRLVHVSAKDAENIVEAARTGNLTLVDDITISADDEEFLNRQTRIALRHCGLIDPESLDDYRNADGYQALEKVLKTMTPEDVIEEMKVSGLAGRGGAGFPTWFKWNAARASESKEKYLICNADEGDPGAFMDRAVIESDPHSLIEGMLIGAYAIGATEMIVYVRAEYPLAIKHLEKAMDDARKANLLGKNILGTDFSCDMRIKAGAGAFVCGEETALMTSIEGKRGEPRPRPPFPAVKGLFGKPTILNNVETYANIAQIILNGAEWFASMGTEKSKGTKVFALGGNIKHTGLVEVPMGTTLRQIVEEIGGGIPSGKKFKAAQTGGPSGGCIPASLMDVEIDYDNLLAIGSMMGSGGLIVMDEDTCMVDIAKFFLEFTVDESCGKCTPCRVGTRRMLEILTKITDGKATMEDLEKLEALCNYIKDNSLCGLGQTAPNPVISTLRYFRDEYIAHIQDKKCPAGACKNLLNYSIVKDSCFGCGMCARNCPADAIFVTDYVAPGKKKPAYEIDTAKCIKCGACIGSCKFNAVIKK